ncbi:hypothetical protein AB6A40_002949 [Gnathostoma spinigerum]|uniref:VWFA domain-containing protein n=1 Tax=Gnathostoma spinigerum TaxID=75299 RepID=A0ABD6E997_9BILA
MKSLASMTCALMVMINLIVCPIALVGSKPRMDLIFLFDVSRSAFKRFAGYEIKALTHISNYIFNTFDTRVVAGSYSMTTNLLHDGDFSKIVDEQTFNESLNRIYKESLSSPREDVENITSLIEITKDKLQQQFREGSKRYLVFTSACNFQVTDDLIEKVDSLKNQHNVNLITISLGEENECKIKSNAVIKYNKEDVTPSLMLSFAGLTDYAIFVDDGELDSDHSRSTRRTVIDYMFNYIEKDNGLDMLYFVMATYDSNVEFIGKKEFLKLDRSAMRNRKDALKRTRKGSGNDVLKVLRKAKELNYSQQRRNALVIVTAHEWVSDESASYFNEAMDLYNSGVDIFVFYIGGKEGTDIDNISPNCTYYPSKGSDISTTIIRETKGRTIAPSLLVSNYNAI